MLKEIEINELKEKARKVRKNIVTMVHDSKSGHPGGSLSGADILTVLFEKSLNIPKEWDKTPDFENRDRFVLSKGHASPLLYSILAMHGVIEEKELATFRKFHSKLQGHPSKGYIAGIETSTGSLGMGLSIGCGMALGLKLKNNPANVVVYLGDGELQEGSCWEAFMQAAHRKLNNLIAIVDRNRLQIDGNTESVMALDDLKAKLAAFNWHVLEIDGHNIEEIFNAVEEAKKCDKPCVIVANTTKGKGVSFMENNAAWHGKAPSDEQLAQALAELEA